MSIQNILTKINSYLGGAGEEVLMVTLIVLSAVFGSGITYIAINSSGVHTDPVFTSFEVEGAKASQVANVTQSIKPVVLGKTGVVYASKNGKKYYYPNCSGLNRIKEENKISFNSSVEAEVEGYTLASGCK